MKKIHSMIVLLALGLASPEQASAARQPKHPQVPPGVEAFYDLPYVTNGHERQKLDLYVPKHAGGDKLPLIVWIHGGGYSSGSKTSCPPLKNGFAARGYAIASIGYRLTDAAPFPAQVQDCKSAVRWLRANAGKYGLDANRIVAWGSSAGASLSLFLGSTGNAKKYDTSDNPQFSSAVQAVISYYGGGDMRAEGDNLTPRNLAAGSTFEKYLGGPALENKEKAAEASAIIHVSKDSAPTHFFHGTADKTVPLARGMRMHEALGKAGVPTKMKTFDGAGHGGPMFWETETLDAVDAFIRAQLPPPDRKAK